MNEQFIPISPPLALDKFNVVSVVSLAEPVVEKGIYLTNYLKAL